MGIPYRMALKIWDIRIIKGLMEGMECDLTPGGWRELISVVATNPVQFEELVREKYLEGAFLKCSLTVTMKLSRR